MDKGIPLPHVRMEELVTKEQWQALLDNVDTFLFDCDGRKDRKRGRFIMHHPCLLATPLVLTRGCG